MRPVVRLAGECLRQRQFVAIELIGVLCATAAAGCGWLAWRTIARAVPPWGPAVLAVGMCLLAATVLVDPAGHLANRWSGWLAQ